MTVTEFGIVIFVRPVQPENAELPISVTELGMTTSFRLTQFLKASFAILVTL